MPNNQDKRTTVRLSSDVASYVRGRWPKGERSQIVSRIVELECVAGIEPATTERVNLSLSPEAAEAADSVGDRATVVAAAIARATLVCPLSATEADLLADCLGEDPGRERLKAVLFGALGRWEVVPDSLREWVEGILR